MRQEEELSCRARAQHEKQRTINKKKTLRYCLKRRRRTRSKTIGRLSFSLSPRAARDQDI